MTLASVDVFLDRRYNRQTYDCLHFTRDVWKAATGEDLGESLGTLLERGHLRKLAREHRRVFRRLDQPEDPCLVLMRRPRTAPHAGVYIRGRVLHLWDAGAEFMPPEVASRGFTSIGYYK